MRQRMICTCVWQEADGGNRAWLSWKAAAACCGNKSCLLLRTLSQSIYSLALSIHVCFHRGVPMNWLHKRKIMFIWFFALRLEWRNKFLIQHFIYLAEHEQHLPKPYTTSHKQRTWAARDLLRLQTRILCFFSRKELWLNLATTYRDFYGFCFSSWKELTKKAMCKNTAQTSGGDKKDLILLNVAHGENHWLLMGHHSCLLSILPKLENVFADFISIYLNSLITLFDVIYHIYDNIFSVTYLENYIF